MVQTAGASAFLSKPFEPDRLLVVVERLLAEQRLQDEKRSLGALIADDAMLALSRAARSGRPVTARREEMTILFTDLVKFTSLASRVEPTELLDLLNGYFEFMIPTIKKHRGDVDKFIGDAIMVRFRRLEGEQTHPLRAVRAGLEMISRLAELNATQPDEMKLKMRVGLNSGEVIIGAVGATARRDFTTLGDVVNMAQRMESAAPPNGVMVTPGTFAAVEKHVEAQKKTVTIKHGHELTAYHVRALKT